MELVERGTALSIMNDTLEACAAGRGGVVLLSGAAATGKTALLRELGARAASAKVLFVQATASDAERSLPLGVIEQLLLGCAVPGARAEVAVGRNDWGAAAGPQDPGAGALPASVVNDLTGICGILMEKSEEIPLVLCVDDVQHADPYSLECLLYLARRSETGRILVVLGESSSFPVENPRFRIELLRLPSCRHVRLRLLTRQGVGRMIAADQDGWRARPLVEEFHRLSGGSPLLVRALLDDLRQRSVPDVEANGGPTGERLPGPAFEQAVTTCLYRSDVTLRNAAWARAVLGPGASHATQADVLATTPELARRSLDALGETGLLSSGWFRHEAVRSAVLHSMDPVHRTRLEARAAQVLHDHGASATVLARHLIAAEPFDAPWALPTLLEAANRALADDETGLALDCLRAARDKCTDERQALSIKALIMRVGWRSGPGAGSGQLPELTAAALAGQLGPRDTESLIAHLLWFGQLDQALDVLDTAERRATPASGPGNGDTRPGPRERFDAVRLRMAVRFPGLSGPTPSGMVGALRRCLPHTQGVEQRAMRLLAGILDGAPGEQRERDVASARAEQMLQGTRLDDHTLPVILIALSVLFVVDELDKAVSWCGLLVKEAEERRAPMWQALFATAKALVEIRLGELEAARESARSALTLVPPEGWGVAVAAPLGALLYTEAATGRLEEAADRLGEPLPDAALHTWGGVLYLWARGHYYLAAGRPYAALDDFLECGRLTTRWGLDLPAGPPWRADAAQACLVLGDTGRARTLVEDQLDRVGEHRTWARGVTLRVLAATVPVTQRPALLEEAVDILRERGHRYEAARAMDDLARAHRELGNIGPARTLARTALRLLRACGVEQPAYDMPPAPSGTVADTGVEQPSTHERSWPSTDGARPQPVDELSDAELRVATLAARGHTNRQIAAQLFITVSTVEQHLTRVYRKLNVRRRTGLAELLEHRSEQPEQPERTTAQGEDGTRDRMRSC
ncbi:LuxR family transcriptional regulator [Streptomyces sp. S.PNR 29]|uniref:helix-turn-helix transcriptional regulator n=1 Tax=Streptomyces sp. S.PNR 29 TaxID=2973805 RepID=UPI0025B0F59B|nr:LuxR family transcriptional regulator [Streptomyces sp. S.PNR 29]MDN0200202.1 AAA family ATPase [Streptomyces sp. S.PNR 29]